MEKTLWQIPLRVLQRRLFYQQAQHYSRERLADWQNKRLVRLVQYAGAHVPYYRRLFREVGLNVASFRGLADLHHIPLLDKETVRTRADELLSDRARRYGVTWDSTSGSTGTPLRFALSDAVQANKIAALLRSFGWAGYRPGMRTLSVQSYYFADRDFEHNRAYNVVRFDSNRLKRESALHLADYLHHRPVRVIIGFPFDILMIGTFAAEAGRPIASPRAVITYGEGLSEHRRGQLESLYGCRVFNFLSMHECSAMIAQCEHGGLHLIEDFCCAEVLDASGEPATEGSLIGTSYYNYTMPLIRYDTRDRVTLADPPCPCGRPFLTVSEIHGKACDYIVTPDGRLLGAVMSHCVDEARGVIASQCIQDALDHITFRLVVDSQYTPESQMALERGLRKRLGPDMRIDLETVDELEKTPGGKTPFIRSIIGNRFQ